MKYRLLISNGRRNIYDFRNELREKGFVFTKSANKYKAFYYKSIEDSDERLEIEKFCRKSKLCVKFEHENFIRSISYRKTFFENYSPLSSGIYRCVYCGKKLIVEDTVVDHLFPIAKAKTSSIVQTILKKIKIESINQIENLVPSCTRCNQKKGVKIGGWTIKGYLGKFKLYWIVLRVFQLIFMGVVVVSIFIILKRGGWFTWLA